MYECPSCGANLKFDIPSQKLSCDYCGNKMDPYAFQKKQDAEEYRRTEGTGDEAGAQAGAPDEYEVTIFTCPQCGGELISDDTTAATFCSFCGGATILDSRISREKCPEFIIPFQKTKEDCKEAYAKMMRRAVFAPEGLKNRDQIEHFRSIYMPYWVYHFEKDGHIVFQGKTVRQRGDYEYTDHYQLETDLYADFNGLSFDASASFSDNLSNAIAPFEWKNAQKFTPSFLSGFYADTNDVGYDAYEERAKKIVVEETRNRVKKHAGCRKYQLSGLDGCVSPDVVRRELAMFPVWFLSYRKDDRVCYAVVNGQTGKAAADIPIDWKKYLIGSGLVALPIFILLNLFVSMRAITMLIWAGILAALCCVVSIRQKKELQARETYADDAGLVYYNAKMRREQFALYDRPQESMQDPQSFWEQQGVQGQQGTPGQQNPQKQEKSKEKISSVKRILILMVMYMFVAPMIMSSGIIRSHGMSFLMLTSFYVMPILVLNVGKKRKKKVPEAAKKQKLGAKSWFSAILKPGLGAVAAVVVIILQPVSDLYYYGAAAIVMGLIAWNMVDIIDRYNLLATRKLPQFNRRGGEEHV